MKVSDFVVKFIENLGVTKVFLVNGGAVLHLVDSISKSKKLSYVCNNHEQASAMAADGYSRVSGNIGVCIATSGAGATNLLTGVAGAYYDSIPLLAITGQVTTSRMKGTSGVRQLGFQETDVVSIFKPVTKYAVTVIDPYKIKYELQKAVYIAQEGRKGSVLVDIPDDIQRMDVDVSKLECYVPEVYLDLSIPNINNVIYELTRAKRPALILGSGVFLSKAEKEVLTLVDKLQIPVLQTWGATGLLPYNHPLNAGYFGQHGSKVGNLTVQNADLLLVLGSRLDSHMIGSRPSDFAPKAKKIIVDIDSCEADKSNPTIGISCDLKLFTIGLNAYKFKLNNILEWHCTINSWKQAYANIYGYTYTIDPSIFFYNLSKFVNDDDLILGDTGSSLVWLMQSFMFKKQRIYSDFNNTSMGWCLPAAIGAHYASGKKIIATMGDGALQMNIQELSTIRLLNIPIKVFNINNNGYSMMKQTQDDWLGSRYTASAYNDIGFPNFTEVSKAYGIRTEEVILNKDIKDTIKRVLKGNDPVFCNVIIPDTHRISQVVKFGEKLA
jgi:acetolactate synthase-1/2/3 large subunit